MFTNDINVEIDIGHTFWPRGICFYLGDSFKQINRPGVIHIELFTGSRVRYSESSANTKPVMGKYDPISCSGCARGYNPEPP